MQIYSLLLLLILCLVDAKRSSRYLMDGGKSGKAGMTAEGMGKKGTTSPTVKPTPSPTSSPFMAPSGSSLPSASSSPSSLPSDAPSCGKSGKSGKSGKAGKSGKRSRAGGDGDDDDDSGKSGKGKSGKGGHWDCDEEEEDDVEIVELDDYLGAPPGSDPSTAGSSASSGEFSFRTSELGAAGKSGAVSMTAWCACAIATAGFIFV